MKTTLYVYGLKKGSKIHRVCIQFLFFARYVYGTNFYPLGIHTVWFSPKNHTQYVYRFFGKPVYIQVALYVYGQSLDPGFNIYNVAKFWVKNREAILTQKMATFISKNRLRFLDQMFTKARTSTNKHKKTRKSTKKHKKRRKRH